MCKAFWGEKLSILAKIYSVMLRMGKLSFPCTPLPSPFKTLLYINVRIGTDFEGVMAGVVSAGGAVPADGVDRGGDSEGVMTGLECT